MQGSGNGIAHTENCGYYLDHKPTSGTWDYVEPTKNQDDDSMGAKLKAFVNAAITDTKYMIRGEQTHRGLNQGDFL
jgi:hypothetical protein